MTKTKFGSKKKKDGERKMINTLKLKAAIAESGMNQEQIAKMLGVSLCTFNYKLNGVSEFKVSEIKKLAELLDLDADKVMKIFLPTMWIENL